VVLTPPLPLLTSHIERMTHPLTRAVLTPPLPLLTSRIERMTHPLTRAVLTLCSRIALSAGEGASQ